MSEAGGSRMKTIYTVPLHVGQNIEVPEGSNVTFYKPGHSVMDEFGAKTDRRDQHAEPPVKGPAPSNDVPRQEPKVGTVRVPWHKK